MIASATTRFGVGIDIEAIQKFQARKKNDVFLKRVFTAAELAYCFAKKDPSQHLAARYAAKEAVVKALSDLGVASLSALDYRDIEVVTKRNGRPVIQGRVVIGLPVDIHISLSHAGEYAIALAFANQLSS